MYVYMFIHMHVYIQTESVQLVLATAASVTSVGTGIANNEHAYNYKAFGELILSLPSLPLILEKGLRLANVFENSACRVAAKRKGDIRIP